MPEEIYLSVAVRLLLMRAHDKLLVDYAHQSMLYYTSNAQTLLTDKFTTYTVHNLIHIVDDVKTHKMNLHELSAFPFENYLQQIKKMVRNNNNPLASIVKQLGEKIFLLLCRKKPLEKLLLMTAMDGFIKMKYITNPAVKVNS